MTILTEANQKLVPRPSLGLLANPIIQTIKSTTRIEDLIGEDIALRQSGAEFMALCPFHREKTPSFTVDPVKGFYHCFGCFAHGDVIDWMTEYRRLTVPQAIRELCARLGIPDPYSPSTPIRPSKPARTRKDDEIEDLLYVELLVLQQYLFPRVNHRRTIRDSAARNSLPYLGIPAREKPPSEPWDREILAADRIVRGLRHLYKNARLSTSAGDTAGE